MREDTGKIVRKYFGFTQVITDDFFLHLYLLFPDHQFLGLFLIYFLVFTYFQNFLGLDLANFATLVCSSL